MKAAIVRWGLLAGYCLLGFLYLNQHVSSPLVAAATAVVVTVGMYLYHFRPMYF